MTMKLTPEYAPVQKLYLCFVQVWFNTRFGYGKTLCEIINTAQPFVDVELFVSPADLPFFRLECDRYQVDLDKVALNYDTPGRAIIAEYVPIFAQDEKGEEVGLIYSDINTMPNYANGVIIKNRSQANCKQALETTPTPAGIPPFPARIG